MSQGNAVSIIPVHHELTKQVSRSHWMRSSRASGAAWRFRPASFGNFREAMADPHHPEHDDLREWYGGYFDPAEFSAEKTSELLRQAATGVLPNLGADH